MLNLLELALNNNYIYMGIIGVLIIIIIITIISIKKDRDEMIAKREEAKKAIVDDSKEEEKTKAKLELEKVVNEMQKNIENPKQVDDDIKTYEEEQEQKAIISYQELVEAVKNHESSQPHNQVGMEVADTTFIDEVENINPTLKEVETSSEPTLEVELPEDNHEDSHDINEMISKAKEEKPLEERKFKRTEVISPVFGRSNTQYPTEIIDDQDEEDEFLDSLKDFRKKL